MRTKYFLRGEYLVFISILTYIYLVSAVIVAGFCKQTLDLSMIWAILIGIVAAPVSFGIGYLLGEACSKIGEAKNSEEGFIGMTSEYFKAKKEAYCPKIEWRRESDNDNDYHE
jgi:hypothetical protein